MNRILLLQKLSMENMPNRNTISSVSFSNCGGRGGQTSAISWSGCGRPPK
ncbi:hypothetical protein [Bacillus thuringiensis]|nr:hypothetical protein [Bacillus thuringiensis]